MGPLDAVWHLTHLLLPAFGVAAIASAATKVLWRRSMETVPWRRLTLWASAAGAVALLTGMLVFGRDGAMATYAGMVLAEALTLWGLGPRRPGLRR